MSTPTDDPAGGRFLAQEHRGLGPGQQRQLSSIRGEKGANGATGATSAGSQRRNHPMPDQLRRVALINAGGVQVFDGDGIGR